MKDEKDNKDREQPGKRPVDDPKSPPIQPQGDVDSPGKNPPPPPPPGGGGGGD